MANLEKKFNPTGNPGWFDPANNPIALRPENIFRSESAFNSFMSPEVYGPDIINQKREQLLAEKAALQQKEFNKNYNSLRLLTRQAFPYSGGEQKADQLALSYLNQINAAESPEELNELRLKLEELETNASSRKAAVQPYQEGESGFLTGYRIAAETGVNIFNAIKNGVYTTTQNLVTGTNDAARSQQNLYKNLEDLNDSQIKDITTYTDPTELFEIVDGVIKQKHSKFESEALFNNIPNFNQTLDKALKNPNKAGAFNDFLQKQYDLKSSRRGDMFYRDDEETKNFLKKKSTESILNPEWEEDKFFKYDLETEFIQNTQSKLLREVDKIDSLPNSELTEDVLAERNKYVERLNSLKGRAENLESIYGINAKNRTGAYRALLNPITSITNLGRNEFRAITYKNALYQPEVIKYDALGRPVTSIEFTYSKEDGSTGYNWESIPEAGANMIGIILPSLGAGRAIGLATNLAAGSKIASLATAGKNLKTGYDALNKVRGLKLADRLSTLGTVTLTTLPMMIEEEKTWGGDYFKRGLAKALVEGVTEAIGFPDIGALRARPFMINLATASKRAAQLNLKTSERLALGLTASAQFGKSAVKQNFIEAFEEEMSLFGNALIEHTMFDESMFTEGQRERTKLSESSISDTFVDSFIGGLLYSAGTNVGAAYNTLRKDNVRNLSNWQAANNPELFKARLQKSFNNGDITQEQFVKGLSRLNELSSVLTDETLGFANLRDLKTLFQDKDAQYEYFQKALLARDLLEFNYDDLTDDDKQALGKVKIQERLSNKAKEKLKTIRERVAILNEKVNSGKELTKEEALESVKLTNTYSILNKLNKSIVNTGELTQEQLKIFQEVGLKVDPTITFTREDYEKELKNITQDILKTRKQINKFENLTELEKQKIVEKLFNDKAQRIQEIDSPYLIKESMKNIKDDLDYLKTTKGANRHEIEQRELLYDAYGRRYYELTNRDENNFNQVEQKFETSGYYTNLKDVGNTVQVLKDLEYLRQNKDVIDNNLFQAIEANLVRILAENIDNISNLTKQERIDTLTKFYEEIASVNPTALYDLDRTNNIFSLYKDNDLVVGSNFTQAEVDQARENYIQNKAAINSNKIANGKKPYEETESDKQASTTPVIPADPNIIQGLDPKIQEELDEDLNEILNIVQTIDPSSEEEDVYSPIVESVKNLVDKYEKQGLPVLKYIADTLVKNTFAYSPKENSPYGLLNNLNQNYLNGRISIDELQDGLENLNKNNPKSLSYLVAYETFATYVDSLGNIVKYDPKTEASLSTSPKAVAKDTTNEKPTTENTSIPKTTEEDEFGDAADVVDDEDEFGDAKDVADDSNAFDKNSDGSTKQADNSAEVITEAKREQLLQLASPLRTIAVELNENDERSTDPADIRRVNHINEAASEDFSPDNTLVLMNRQKFIRMYLEAKFPNKSTREIDEDINTINKFFEESEEGTPLPKEVVSLIGETLFSNGERPKETGRKSEVYYWQSNKGKGFSQQPDVVVTYLDGKGKLLMFSDGYPLDLNTTAFDKEGKISWNVSKRIRKQLLAAGISEEQIVEAHKTKADAFINLKAQITADNNKVVYTSTHSISEGLIITNPKNYVAGSTLAAENNQGLGTPTIDSFKLVTNLNENVFGQRNQFELGRLYYNVNGTPVKLSNRRIDQNEAEALADLLYGNPLEYPDEFETLDEFRQYLFNLINDINKETRFYFILNSKYDSNNPEDNPILVRRRLGNNNFETVSKENFIETLTKSFYKASKENIKNNKTIPRYSKVDGQIQVTKQSQANYLLSTHDFPTDGEGTISTNVNKVINFQPKLSQEELAKLQPSNVTKKTSTPTAPVSDIEAQKDDIEQPSTNVVARVISGGQTGADRLGLEVAKELGIETGGVAPKGYKTEKGSDSSLKDFGLTEDPSSSYNPRTEQNVKSSDATVIFGDVNSAGSKLTVSLLKKNNKPYIINPTAEQLSTFLKDNKVKVLNVAGNRGSKLSPSQIEEYKNTLRIALGQPAQTTQPEVTVKPVPVTRPSGKTTKDGFVIMGESKDAVSNKPVKVIGSFNVMFPNRTEALAATKAAGINKSTAILEKMSDEEYANILRKFANTPIKRSIKVFTPQDGSLNSVVDPNDLFTFDANEKFLVLPIDENTNLTLPLITKDTATYSLSFDFVDYQENEVARFKKEGTPYSSYSNVISAYNPNKDNKLPANKEKQSFDSKGNTPADASKLAENVPAETKKRPSLTELKNKNPKLAKHMNAEENEVTEAKAACTVKSSKLLNKVGVPKQKTNPFKK